MTLSPQFILYFYIQIYFGDEYSSFCVIFNNRKIDPIDKGDNEKELGKRLRNSPVSSRPSSLPPATGFIYKWILFF